MLLLRLATRIASAGVAGTAGDCARDVNEVGDVGCGADGVAGTSGVGIDVAGASVEGAAAPEAVEDVVAEVAADIAPDDAASATAECPLPMRHVAVVRLTINSGRNRIVRRLLAVLRREDVLAWRVRAPFGAACAADDDGVRRKLAAKLAARHGGDFADTDA